MKNGAVRNVANYKDYDGGNYKASLPHMPVIDPIDHRGTVQIGAGYSTVLITAPCLVNSIAACMAKLLSNSFLKVCI